MSKTEKSYVAVFWDYDTIFSHGKNFLVPEHSLRSEEYLAFLKKHGTHFDEKYLWD
jgi:hypothetical protein